MAIAKVTKGRKSKRLFKYLTDEKPKTAHEGLSGRVLSVSGQNVDLSDNHYEHLEAQYRTLRELSGKEDKNHQIYHVIQSFHSDELSFTDSTEVDRANRLGLDLGKEIAGESSQIVVVTQADNDAGILHNHIVIGGVLLNGKSLQTNNVSVKNVRSKNDEVLARYGMEQHKNIKNAEVQGRKTIAEREINSRGEMTKKDIMRQKLDSAIDKATSVEEFEKMLEDDGVELVRGKRKKQEIFKYRDENDSKAMTDRALGENYSIDAVLEQIQANYERQKREKEEEEEQEKEKKKRELEDSVSENNESESDDIKDVQEAEPTPTEPKNSLDLLLEKANSLKSIDTRSKGYTGSRIESPSSDFDLEL